ncbi:hypothetical protein RFI_20357, partial [Reticulomyxa filosa]
PREDERKQVEENNTWTVSKSDRHAPQIIEPIRQPAPLDTTDLDRYPVLKTLPGGDYLVVDGSNGTFLDDVDNNEWLWDHCQETSAKKVILPMRDHLSDGAKPLCVERTIATDKIAKEQQGNVWRYHNNQNGQISKNIKCLHGHGNQSIQRLGPRFETCIYSSATKIGNRWSSNVTPPPSKTDCSSLMPSVHPKILSIIKCSLHNERKYNILIW